MHIQRLSNGHPLDIHMDIHMDVVWMSIGRPMDVMCGTIKKFVFQSIIVYCP